MRMVSGEARKAGNRNPPLHAKAVSAKDFYTEVPFEVELDGPFYTRCSDSSTG